MKAATKSGEERRKNHSLRKLVDLTHSAAPAGNVLVMHNGIWAVFREAGNVHVYPERRIIEVSGERVLEKGKEIAAAYVKEGYGEYDIRIKS